MMINLQEERYSEERLISDAKALAMKYSNIIQCVTIGSSHDNRDIILLKLGKGKKNIICCGGVHARETINPIVMMGMIEYYAELYVHHKERKSNLFYRLSHTSSFLEGEYEEILYGSCVIEMLHTYTIHFVPLLNPDGYMISLDGFDAIKDVELRQKCLEKGITHHEWKFNGRGVDINRNFPSRLWQAKDEQDHAASENETKILISLFHEYKSEGFLDFHSRGKSIYYYRKEMSDQYNVKQKEIAKRLSTITGYSLVHPVEEIDPGDSGGNTVHYYSEHFYKPALTIETVEDEATFPLNHKYREGTFQELKLIMIEFASRII